MNDKYDMSVIDDRTLYKLKAPLELSQWFVAHVGSLPVSKLKEVTGEYKDYIKTLKLLYGVLGGKEKTFDENGNVLTERTNDGLIKYTYKDNHLIRTDKPDGSWVKRWVSDGKVVMIENSEGEVQNFKYKDGLLIEVIESGGIVAFYKYDEDHKLIKSVEEGITNTYMYDQFGNLIDKLLVSKTFTEREIFLYNENGDVTSYQLMSDRGNKFSYTKRYNRDGQLCRYEDSEYNEYTIAYGYAGGKVKSELNGNVSVWRNINGILTLKSERINNIMYKHKVTPEKYEVTLKGKVLLSLPRNIG